MARLPFKDRADLTELGGHVQVADLPCSVWPLPNPRETATGEAYDWTGQADHAFAAELEVPNRFLAVRGRKLRIVGNAVHDFLPHVQLQLLEIRPGG